MRSKFARKRTTVVYVKPAGFGAAGFRVPLEDLVQHSRRELRATRAMFVCFTLESSAHHRRDLDARSLEDADGFLVRLRQPNVQQGHTISIKT